MTRYPQRTDVALLCAFPLPLPLMSALPAWLKCCLFYFFILRLASSTALNCGIKHCIKLRSLCRSTVCWILTLVSLLQMSFDPGMLHNNGHTAYANGTGPGIRETGVVEKLLTSYGFIQCSERQARLFFHCSQYNGNLQELKIGGERALTHRKSSFGSSVLWCLLMLFSGLSLLRWCRVWSVLWQAHWQAHSSEAAKDKARGAARGAHLGPGGARPARLSLYCAAWLYSSS